MKEHHTSSPFRDPYSLWKGAARVALVAGLTLIAVTLLSACGDGAQATQSLVSKSASTATPEPTPIPTTTPEPTPIPTATPEPTPVSTATPDSLDGDCAGALTKGHSLEKILTDEELMRCLHEKLITEPTPIPAATPIPIVTPEPAHVSSPTPIPTATPEPTLVSSPTPIPTETPEPTLIHSTTPGPTPISTATPEPTPVSSPTPDSLDGDCEGVLTKGHSLGKILTNEKLMRCLHEHLIGAGRSER